MKFQKESTDTYGIGSVSSGYSGSRSLTRGDKSFWKLAKILMLRHDDIAYTEIGGFGNHSVVIWEKHLDNIHVSICMSAIQEYLA